MQLPPEWLEFLRLLTTNQVRFVIVGAYAMAANGRPRASQDIDIFIEPSAANAKRVGKAIGAFGYEALAKAAPTEFATPPRMAKMGVPPLRIDVMNAIDGVPFADAFSGSIEADAGDGLRVRFLGIRELVKNKSSTGRTKDKLDVELLREAGLIPDEE